MTARPANAKPSPPRVIASNKKAYHDYHVEETYTAGIILTGTEIKSIRNGQVSLNEGFARIENSEVFLYGMHVSPYDKGTHYNHAPDRVRKLLMTRAEIRKLVGKTKQTGLTLIPLKLVFDRCWVKVEVGLCRGKKLYDKREALTERQHQREMDRARKGRASS
ncbi:MAG: SsrA-binding protein SmpB [Vampirovibrionales bacterium]|nr:SsrA-binding protein SmpB [Vampirovibrionales bacterium]